MKQRPLFSITQSMVTVLLSSSLALEATAALSAPPDLGRQEVKAMDGWQVTCSYDKGDKKLGCNALLRITEPARPATAQTPARPGNLVMIWALSKANDGQVYSSFQTLTGVRIQPGLQLKIGSATPRTIPFDSCGTSSCVAIASMDPKFVEQASSATSIAATVLSTDGKAYTATFNPKGVDKAIAAVK